MTAIPGIICQRCNHPTPKRGPGIQKYCPPCSAIQDMLRKRKSARKRQPMLRTALMERGEKISADYLAARKLRVGPPVLIWERSFSVPFSQAASKNHVWTLAPGGHIFKRKETVVFKAEITRQVIAITKDIKIA